MHKWRLTYIRVDHGWPVDIARQYIMEDTEDAAKARGIAALEIYGANFVDVIKVH